MPRPRAKRQYGLGELEQRGNRWRARYRDRLGRRHSKSFLSRETADRWLRLKTLEAEQIDSGHPRDPGSVPVLGKLVPPWLESRKSTHRSARDDRSRWRNHLEPALANLRPDEVDAGEIRRLVLGLLEKGLSSTTVRLCMRLISTLYSDLIDDHHATRNPVSKEHLSKKVRRLFRPAHDPKTTPFVDRQEDIGRVYLELPEPVNVAYAIGALAGPRTGEILALRWPHVDLERRRIHIRESIKGPLKDDDSRVVPILDALAPILSAWQDRARTRTGRVIPPLRARASHLDPHTVGSELTEALERLKLPALTWYQATRHTFASHWVMAGGSLEQLREILGHSSIVTTERYAHLRPEMYGAAAHGRLHPLRQPETPSLPPRQLRGLRGKLLEN